MGMENNEIGWFSPKKRGLLPLPPGPLPHGVRRDLRKFPWVLKTDTRFAEVMRLCANREETWISAVIVESYCGLFDLGFAHSVEVWLEDELVGGLYGVHIGGVFFGESMFHSVSGASKVALVALMNSLHISGFKLLDTQWITPHLRQFGAVEMTQDRYLKELASAITKTCVFPSDVRLPQ